MKYVYADYGQEGWIRKILIGRLMIRFERGWTGGLGFLIYWYPKGIRP